MAKEKGVQVSATVTKEVDDTLENHRWDVRLTKTELVRTAILEYISNHNLTVEVEPASEPAEQNVT
jgi:hypothetical protein